MVTVTTPAMDLTMKDYYEVLGVRRGASTAEIELAYKGRRTQYHPDKYGTSDAETLRWATARMQEVNAAYAVLSDGQRRARFDAGNVDNAAADDEATAQADAAAPATVSLRTFLHQRFAPYGRFSRTYFAPDIPLKKLSNALQSYGRGVQAEEVVALMDTTVFGGAKDGVMLTEKQIRLKDLGSGLAIWEWPNIRTIDAEKTGIYVNGHKLIDCLAVEVGEVGYLVGGLQEFLQVHGEAPPKPQAQDEPRAERRQEGAARPLPEKYRNMYDMAKREFVALCQMLQKIELHLEKEFVDRDNAVAYFGYLEQGLQEAGKAEKAWAILGEIAVLSKAVVVFSETGKPAPPVLALGRDDDSQLVAELRALLRFLLNVLENVEQKARTAQFFKL